MTMMNRHVRVSVRELSESVDATWGAPGQSHAHLRYQRLRALAPLSGEAIMRLQREGFVADWEAVAARKPEIADGWMLVTYDDAGTTDLRFRVVKALKRGRKMHLYLKEIMEDQS